ncbi:hypothetical protein [Ferrovibrio sp.]|uniref:hypothetical protein n=1 Tax=Ferrovibrio sp. TaxID=1917215 RepID=UPI0031202954
MSNEQDDTNSNEPGAGNQVDRPETLPATFRVNVRGWEENDEEGARKFGEGVLAITKKFSTALDLSRLEEVVIAWDYPAALASIDRGHGTPPATPTANEYGEGQAMALQVVRDNEIWNVVVIWTGLVRQLLEPEHPNQNLAFQTFLHELIHVDDLRFFTRTFPGGWKAATPKNKREGALQSIVNPCQSEYSAQRRSASALPGRAIDMLDMLEKAMNDVEAQIRTARLEYRVTGDLDNYWPIVTNRLTFLFQALGYALGHSDWVLENRSDYPDLVKEIEEKLASLKAMQEGWMIDACRDAVRPFWDMSEWQGLEVYDPLIEVAEQFLNRHGMYTRAEGHELYVDMPYTGLHDL